MQLRFSEFESLVEDYRDQTPDKELVVPVYKRLSADLLTPVSAYLSLREANKRSFLLESVEGGNKLGRYSFIGTSPYRIVQARGHQVTISQPDSTTSPESRDASIFSVMEELLSSVVEVPIPDLPRLRGGAVGYLGYDTVRLVEDLPNIPRDDLDLPDAIWAFYDQVAAFDHVKRQLILVANAFVNSDRDLRESYESARNKIGQMEEKLTAGIPEHPDPVEVLDAEMSSNIERKQFEEAVERAKQYIYEGDIFQVVLSQRFEMPFTGDRFNLYRALRQVNPSPYLFYLDLGDFSLVGSSPEVLVRQEDERVELLPIAGTRRRGETDEEDEELAQELLNDPKERAEHVMLVDLGRNDLGRVCEYDTVEVDRFGYIERYSHVMHIVSSVSGQLRNGYGPMDALAACFPAGTVSGAPKVRAMEIIDELEPTKRGIYAGAVGYVDFSGTLDTCIAIRTMLVHENTIYVQAGAGIVADSDPAREYEETVNKAQALQQAIRMAGDDLL